MLFYTILAEETVSITTITTTTTTTAATTVTAAHTKPLPRVVPLRVLDQSHHVRKALRASGTDLSTPPLPPLSSCTHTPLCPQEAAPSIARSSSLTRGGRGVLRGGTVSAVHVPNERRAGVISLRTQGAVKRLPLLLLLAVAVGVSIAAGGRRGDHSHLLVTLALLLQHPPLSRTL
jgi:hypothetical protein